MRIHVEDHVTNGRNSLRRHAIHCIETALSRGFDRIRRVSVEFSDADSAGCRAASRCFIRIETVCGRVFALDETRRCVFTAFDRALGTARRLVRGIETDPRIEGAMP